MSKEIKSTEEIKFGKTYQIEVLSDEFKGSFDDDTKVFTECSPEVKTKSSVDFSISEDAESYEDIPDEDIIVVNQEDIDKGFVVVRELL